MQYDFKHVETVWKQKWASDNPLAQTQETGSGKKFYCLDMFPYPSGSGLHVGHWRGYVLSDVYARMYWLKGYNVLHPMGWDAFGLPAENDAIKKGLQPALNTAKNIAHFKKQLIDICALYDWNKEINTTDPDYYKWTQWIFLVMYERGLAYETLIPVNWCPSCLTGLANEEVVDGSCERCGTPVEQKNIRQWVLRITQYAQRLLDGLDKLEWPEKVKMMQKNWIGRSDGLVFTAPVKDTTITIETFSAHFESFAADTFVVIAPDHPLLERLVKGVDDEEKILAYAREIINKRATKDYNTAEPDGIFTGRYIVDPVGNGELPIWVASFALAHYGTGIVKCSAHDERDFAFAKKYNIRLKTVLFPEDPLLAEKVKNLDICYTDMHKGILSEPSPFAGKKAGSVRREIIDYCITHNLARPQTTYRLRDWIFSRQRYWGEPIPLIHCVHCGVVPVAYDQLPVTLPDVESYQPTGTGESPLAAIESWVHTTCPSCHGNARRETNTMPQWAGSSWYFLRYPNPHNNQEAFSQQDMNYWLPVDLYVGGIEHAILHLLYARFYVKVLYDAGYLPYDEPFKQLFNQGMILKRSPKTGLIEKMSKSKGNVVNPESIVEKYGSDALRLYILFIGPPELDCEWQDTGLEGIKRFLNRFYTYFSDKNNIYADDTPELDSISCRIEQFLKEFQERLALFKPNTAVSAFMELLNDLTANNARISRQSCKKILVCLSVMAPIMASELLENIFGIPLDHCSWPTYNPDRALPPQVTIAVAVNGKLRATVTAQRGESHDVICSKAEQEVKKWINSSIKKTIFIKDKMVNFVLD